MTFLCSLKAKGRNGTSFGKITMFPVEDYRERDLYIPSLKNRISTEPNIALLKGYSSFIQQ
jgi:hypothetical protein